MTSKGEQIEIVYGDNLFLEMTYIFIKVNNKYRWSYYYHTPEIYILYLTVVLCNVINK